VVAVVVVVEVAVPASVVVDGPASVNMLVRRKAKRL
jgi:hypothetical protein